MRKMQISFKGYKSFFYFELGSYINKLNKYDNFFKYKMKRKFSSEFF
jgi:hypothetical protein